MSAPGWYDEMLPLANRCRSLASWRTTDSEIRTVLDEAFNLLGQAHAELVWFRDRIEVDLEPRVEVEAFSELEQAPVIRVRGWDEWAAMVQAARKAAASHDFGRLSPVVDGSGFWVLCECGEMLGLLDEDEPLKRVQEKLWRHRKRVSG